MEQRADLEGQQVKCLIASGGHLWMQGYFDRIPSVVRRRLAKSAFNICPACTDKEAHAAAPSTQRNQALRWHLFPRGRAALKRAARRGLGVLMVPTPAVKSGVNGPTIDRTSGGIAAENSPATSVASFQQDGRDIRAGGQDDETAYRWCG